MNSTAGRGHGGMAIKQTVPYISFGGDAERAIQLYERALGAETKSLMRWEEMPSGPPGPDMPSCPPEHGRRIMHAELRVGEAAIYLADVPDDRQPSGDRIEICLLVDDADDMARKFEALAVGGEVTMAIHEPFWGGKYGVLTDEFGVGWMFVYGEQPE
jgi:PhnB protein